MFVIINLLIVWAFISFSGKTVPSTVVTTTVTPTQFPTPTPAIISSDKLFQLVNKWRVQNGYQAYKKSEFAESIATERLLESKQVWTHEKFIEDAEANKYCTDCYLGENLSRNILSESETLDAWLNSPSHKANLERSYTHSAIVCDNTVENYCVHIFSFF